MPERQFPISRITAFLKLVLVPAGLWDECWRHRNRILNRVRRRDPREGWLKLMGEPSHRHGEPWGRVVIQQLEVTAMRCLVEPDPEMFAYLKDGMPWRSMTGKERLQLGLLAARELGLDVSVWTDKSPDSSVQILRSRNWALSSVGKELVKQSRGIERRGVVANAKTMSPREVVDWVMENLDNQNVSKYPNGSCRGMLLVAKGNPEKFVTEYMRLAYRVDKAPADVPPEEPEGVAASLDTLLGAVIVESGTSA